MAAGALLPTLRHTTVRVLAVALLCTRAFADDFQAVAVTDPAWQPRDARLTLGTARQIAEGEVARRGLSVESFRPPWFRYEYEVYYPDLGAGDYAWAFLYAGKAPDQGNHFLVIVNDRTRYAEFIPGR